MANSGNNTATIISIFSLCAATASAYFSWSANNQSTLNQAQLNQSTSIGYLNDALDKMGNNDNSSSIIINSTTLTPSESARFENARRLIDQAKTLSPDFYMTHHYYGLYLQRMGRLDEAEDALSLSIELLKQSEETNWWPYSDLGHVQALAGKTEQAEKSYKRALEIDPYDPRLRINLAIFYKKTGNDTLSNEQWCLAKEYQNFINEPVSIINNLQCN